MNLLSNKAESKNYGHPRNTLEETLFSLQLIVTCKTSCLLET